MRSKKTFQRVFFVIVENNCILEENDELMELMERLDFEKNIYYIKFEID